MKIFMINTVCGVGSTGRICTDIAAMLKSKGHNCVIAYGQQNTDYENSFKIGRKLENHFHNAYSRVSGKQGYCTLNGTLKLVEKIKLENPDVIHLHNLHGNYLHLKTLFDFLKIYKGKIVWTLHDCWAFTGKCSHYVDASCYKWKSKCFQCPQIKEYPPSLFFDRSEQMFEDKFKLYKDLNINVVAVSDWLLGEVNKSVLLSSKNTTRIYNWVDHKVFTLSKVQNTKNRKILFVAAFWNSGSSKTKRLIYLAQKLQYQYSITVIGVTDDQIKKQLLKVNFIDYISSIEEIAGFYQQSDVFVHLSTEDTFGLVIAESMSCGTPVVAFDSTACGEIVGDERCGAIVKNEDLITMELRIRNVLEIGKNFYEDSCRDRVLKNFCKETNINKYLEIYTSLCY